MHVFYNFFGSPSHNFRGLATLYYSSQTRRSQRFFLTHNVKCIQNCVQSTSCCMKKCRKNNFWFTCSLEITVILGRLRKLLAGWVSWWGGIVDWIGHTNTLRTGGTWGTLTCRRPWSSPCRRWAPSPCPAWRTACCRGTAASSPWSWPRGPWRSGAGSSARLSWCRGA